MYKIFDFVCIFIKYNKINCFYNNTYFFGNIPYSLN